MIADITDKIPQSHSDGSKSNCQIKLRKRRIEVIIKYLVPFVTLVSLMTLGLPFIRIDLGTKSVELSAVMVLIANIRVSLEYLLVFPLLLRFLIIASSVLLLAAGVTSFVLKKHVLASAFSISAMLFQIIASIFSSEISKSLVSNGIGRPEVSMRYGWVLFLILTVILSLSILAQEGLEKAAEQVFKFTALISVGIVVTMTVYMFAYGTPAIAEIGLSEFLFGQEWRPTAGEPKFGILHMILATLFGCVGAIAIGVPVGLFTAVFLAEVAPKRIGDIIRPAVDLLAGIPSVIYGFIGMKILVPFLREIGVKLGFNTTGSGLAAVIIVLAVMILPTIVRVTETTLRSVPRSYTEAALALGNTKISTIFSVQIPAARSGILAGVILGVGRAIGETMAVIMVAGNIVKFPTLFSSVRPMTAGIAFEMGYAEAGLHRQSLFGIGLVLFVFIMIVNISFSYISKKGGFTGEN